MLPLVFTYFIIHYFNFLALLYPDYSNSYAHLIQIHNACKMPKTKYFYISYFCWTPYILYDLLRSKSILYKLYYVCITFSMIFFITSK